MSNTEMSILNLTPYIVIKRNRDIQYRPLLSGTSTYNATTIYDINYSTHKI